jgi:molybdopterin-binding protein
MPLLRAKGASKASVTSPAPLRQPVLAAGSYGRRPPRMVEASWADHCSLVVRVTTRIILERETPSDQESYESFGANGLNGKTRKNPFAHNSLENRTMKISARNVLEGTIKEIKEGTTTAHILIDVKGMTVTAAITNESVEDLHLEVGKKVKAIIKSSDVMVATD